MLQRKNINRKSVLVGMSGGIDSSVALLLLKEQGFDVAGLFLKMDNSANSENCKRTRKIATLLGIHLFEKNISKEFNKKVIQYFINSYKKNLTPNPCVVCNQGIKFRFLVQEAEKNNFDFIATGHYAKIKKDKNGIFSLLRGEDKIKDQSYFIYRLRQNILKKVIFPLGKFKKKQLIKIVKNSVLKDINFEKESQDVCFLNNRRNLKKFLSIKITAAKKGNIIDENGKILGKHSGLEIHTKGQRKGLNLAGGPYFVIGKDAKKGELIVSKKKNHPKLLSKEIRIKKINWIYDKPTLDKKYYFKNRYKSKLTAGYFKRNRREWRVVLDKKQWAIMEGQSLVAYSGQKVIGGGIIESTMMDS